MQFTLCLMFTICFLTVFAIECPRNSFCVESQSCCPTEIPGLYSCCAFKDGVCCEDLVSCCPKNFKCDILRGKCDLPEIDLQKLDKRQGLPAEEKPFYQNRCDDKSYCPYGSTCCPSPDGAYGCCPFSDATCCPDKIHCCPHNEKCDATSEYCIGTDINYPSKTKEPTIAIDEESLI